MLIIVVAFFYGMVVFVIPVFIFFEISRRKKRSRTIAAPYLKGAILNFILGVVVIGYMMKQAHGEAGFAAVVMAPFILIGAIIVGICVGSLYKRRERPFFGGRIRLRDLEKGDRYSQENDDKACEFYEKSIRELYDRFGDILERKEYKYLPINFDKVLEWLAQYYEDRGAYDKSIHYYEHYFDMSELYRHKSKFLLGQYLDKLGHLYSEIGNNDTAEILYKKANEYKTQKNT